MGPIIIIKSGTTSIEGDIVKGDFSYFSASTLDLGPTSKTGLYSGIDAPDGGYTIYQIGGPDGLNIRLATNTTELNSILITAGATGSTLNDRITWATNTNSIFVNSGITLSTFYYYGGQFTTVNVIQAPKLIQLNSDNSKDTTFNIGTGFDSTVRSIAIQTDGKILVGGLFTTFTGSTQNRLIRLNTDGSKDTAFNIGTGFNSIVQSITNGFDEKLLVGGEFTTYNGSQALYNIILNNDGSLSNNQLTFNDFIYSINFS